MIKKTKEIKRLLHELTKDLDEVDKAVYELEPYSSIIDGLIDKIIENGVLPEQFKYFEACKFKAKTLWYIKRNIEKWDKKYRKTVLLCVREKNFKHFQKAQPNSLYYYFPFFEALEFENLLFQGKACLDSFSKAIGSIFSEKTKTLGSLKRMLMEKANRDIKASELLSTIKGVGKLNGIILNSKKEKNYIRNLITHEEKADISFWIRRDKNKFIVSKGALFKMRHPDLPLLPNYLVVNIARNIWYYTDSILTKSFEQVLNFK